MEENFINGLSSILQNVERVVDEKFVKIYLESLPESQKKIGHLSSEICHNQGVFDIGTSDCICDIAFFGSRCHVRGITNWGGVWTAFQVLFSFYYVIFAIITIIHLRKTLKTENDNLWVRIKRMCQAPKYFVIINLLILSISRIVYVTVDPFRQHEIFTRVFDRVIYELIFSTIISMFFVLLLVWVGLYGAFDIDTKHREIKKLEYKRTEKQEKVNKTEIKGKPKPKYSMTYYRMKNVVVIVLFCIYPMQIVFSWFRGLRGVTAQTFNTIMYCLLAFGTTFIFLFIYYSCKLKYTLSKCFKPPTEISQRFFLKQNPSQMTHFNQPNIITQDKNANKENVVEEAKDQTSWNLMKKYIITKLEKDQQSIEDADSDSELDFNEEMENLDMSNVCSSEEDEVRVAIEQQVAEERLLIDEGENEIGRSNMIKTNVEKEDLESKALKGVQEDQSNSGYVLTSEDMRILNKFFGISYLIVIIAFFILIIGMILGSTSVLDSSNGTITLIIFSFLFEVISLTAIFYLFVQDVESKQYDNLKIIGEIDRYLSNSEKRLKFRDLRDTAIISRFGNFMDIIHTNDFLP